MSRSEFLFTSPREFDAMTERLNLKREQERYSTASIIAAIYNSVCNYDKRPEGFSPEDFLPGKKSSRHQTLEEFAIECEKNDFKPLAPTEEDKAAADKFLEGFKKTFSHQDQMGKVQLVKE
jgi:hypothetical protein